MFLGYRLTMSISGCASMILCLHKPSTNRLFSGSLFPLEMLSSIGFHISSLSASTWLAAVREGKLEARRVLMAEVLRSVEPLPSGS